VQAADRQLATWTGSALEAVNVGCHLDTGALVCQIAKPGNVEVTAIVEQSELAMVQPGAGARVALPLAPWQSFRGTVESVAQRDADSLPPSLVNSGRLPQETGADGQRRPLETLYQVRIRMDDATPGLLPGTMGRVRIVAPPETLAARIKRWLARTFRLATA
jgi:hypothetical protein